MFDPPTPATEAATTAADNINMVVVPDRHDVLIVMEPRQARIDLEQTALLLIDMQRDFLEPGGFGEALGNDVTKLQRAIKPCSDLLRAARNANLLIIHTREGHRPDLRDLHDTKRQRPGIPETNVIGKLGALGGGRILVRGEPGHAIIPQLAPRSGEPIVDKPGKGAFYATDLEAILQASRIRYLLVGGVTTEVCVQTTIREANDRGYYCIAVSDACASYSETFHRVALEMVAAQNALFGSVATSHNIVAALQTVSPTLP